LSPAPCLRGRHLARSASAPGLTLWLTLGAISTAHAGEPGQGQGQGQEDDRESPDTTQAGADDEGPRPWTDYAPAAADASQIRSPGPSSRLYLDAGLARSNDLSALPYMEGKGQNLRAALGASFRVRRFQFDFELPASQATTLDITHIPGGEPEVEDKHQTSYCIGDLRVGAQWSAAPFAGVPFLAGVGVRGRIPTHTVRFRFHLPDGSIGLYSFPYYFHVEPALLFGGALGPLSLVMNQGPLILIGPDAVFEQVRFVVPTIYFWDSHLAAVLALARWLALSVELNTIFQLSHVDGLDFMKLNGIRAWSVLPGLQVHLGDYRIDAIGRIGLSRGAELFGVIGYGGSNSVTLRVSRSF